MLDPRIKDAIMQATSEIHQDPELGRKLIAWFEALANGNEQLGDREAVYRRAELLYDATSVEISDDR